MKPRTDSHHLAHVALLIFLLAKPVAAQVQGAKKPVGYDAYDGWRSIQGTGSDRSSGRRKWSSPAAIRNWMALSIKTFLVDERSNICCSGRAVFGKEIL